MHIDYFDYRPDITYHGFWPAFSIQREGKAFHELLQLYFKNVTIPIDVYSVFKDYSTDQRKPGRLSVGFSGEAHYHDPKNFDISLIMEPDDIEKRIIFAPLFAIGSHEMKYWQRYQQPRPLYSKNRFCAFVVSNPTAHIRNTFFQKLNVYKRVDSCGCALNNCGFTAPKGDAYLQFLQQFKFNICFENKSKPYYLTEKLHNAWLGGCIPIYYGCPNVHTWLNKDAFLYLEDDSEEAMNRLIARIIELDNDDEKYMEMYRQPLIIGEIPQCMTIEHVQKQVEKIINNENQPL
jgi:hypothetical protein